jgi:TorA maturation chaperone TorD
MKQEAEPVTADDPEALLAAFCDGVADDLKLLAELHDREIDALALAQLKAHGFPETLALSFSGEQARDAREFMATVVADVPAAPDATYLDELAVDYADIYLTYRLRAAPTESVWRDEENLERQRPMFEVRAAYRLRRLKVDDWHKRPDDHLVTQLHYIAHLIGACRDERALREAARFLDGHLLKWIDQFANRVAQRSRTPFYSALGLLTASYLDELREVLGALSGIARPTAEEPAAKNIDPEFEELKVLPTNTPAVGPSW